MVGTKVNSTSQLYNIIAIYTTISLVVRMHGCSMYGIKIFLTVYV